MTLSTTDLSYFSNHVYGDMKDEPALQKDVVIKKESGLSSNYKILEIIENKLTGYHGAIYRNEDTGELVAAHRGTEMKKNVSEFTKDLLITDGAMVLEAVNVQVPDAVRLMERAKELSQLPRNLVDGQPAPISTTGHSLGGTLAQCMAQRYNVPGQTFNAYGAVGLHGVEQELGRQPVINHMRATDFVSASNGHFGEVRVYANAEDITALSKAGDVANRQGSSGFMYDVVRNVNAHTMGESFWPNSVISEVNRQRYLDNAPLVNAFREDALNTRAVITYSSQAGQAMQLDPDAIKYLATQPLPKIPDHVERSVINAVLRPQERALEATGDVASGFAKANAAVAEQSTLATGRVLGAAIELPGRAQAQVLDTAGDIAAKAQQTQGHVQQVVTVQTGHVVGAVVEGISEVKAHGRGLLGGIEAFGERLGAESQSAVLSAGAAVNRLGGWLSDDMKERAQTYEQAAASVKQQGLEKSQAAFERAGTDAKDIRQSAQQSADGIERLAVTVGVAQRESFERSGVSNNAILDSAGQGVQKNTEQAAQAVRSTSADIGENQRQTIQNTGAAIERGLDHSAQNIKNARESALDIVTNPRSAEGPARGPSLAELGHPNHSLYVQAHDKLERMGATTGLSSHQQLDNVAGALAAAAAKEGLDRIDHVLISKDGKRFFAVEGGINDPAHMRADVHTQEAKQQTIDQSTKLANQAIQAGGSQEPSPTQGMRR